MGATRSSVEICLGPPPCSPTFESQAHHLHLFQFRVNFLSLCWEKDEKKQNRGRVRPIKNRFLNLSSPFFVTIFELDAAAAAAGELKNKK